MIIDTIQSGNIQLRATSPTNFIISIDGKNYVGSAEFCFTGGQESELINSRLPHSTVLTNNQGESFRLYALFELEKATVSTDEFLDLSNKTVFANAFTEDSTVSSDLKYGVNSNLNYAYMNVGGGAEVPFFQNSFGVRLRKQYTNTAAYSYGYADIDHSINLYNKNNHATHAANALRLGKQYNFPKDVLISPIFKFDTFSGFRSDESRNRLTSPISSWIPGINNFDEGFLYVDSFIFPKVTLNDEYSTQKNDIPGSILKGIRTYWYTRSFGHMSRDGIVQYYLPALELKDFDPTEEFSSEIAINTEYSEVIGQPDPISEVRYREPKSIRRADWAGEYRFPNAYMPEFIDPSLETSGKTNAGGITQHKANVFAINVSNKYGETNSGGIYGLLEETAQKLNSPLSQDNVDEAYQNIKKTIKSQLHKAIAEVKPAHTELYRVIIDKEDDR